MKNILVLSALAIGVTYADYKVTYPLDSSSVIFRNNEPVTEKWIPGVPVVGAWVNKGSLFNCNTTPLINGSFTHIKTCSQQQTQNIITPATSNITHEVRYTEITKEQTIAINENLTEQWIAGSPVLSIWTDKDDLFDCSTLPSVNDYSTGVAFTQTKTCSQKQEQTVNTPETSSITNDIRQVETLNEQIITKKTDNNAVGERYTNIIKVGYYTLPYNNYSGYLNPNYKSYPDYNEFTQQAASTLTPNSIAGAEIRWMWTYMDGNLVVMPANKALNSNLVKYNVTVNGVTCPLVMHTYEMDVVVGSNCFSFINKVGSEFKMDITLK
jgi:hypothetical protein